MPKAFSAGTYTVIDAAGVNVWNGDGVFASKCNNIGFGETFHVTKTYQSNGYTWGYLDGGQTNVCLEGDNATRIRYTPKVKRAVFTIQVLHSNEGGARGNRAALEVVYSTGHEMEQYNSEESAKTSSSLRASLPVEASGAASLSADYKAAMQSAYVSTRSSTHAKTMIREQLEVDFGVPFYYYQGVTAFTMEDGSVRKQFGQKFQTQTPLPAQALQPISLAVS